MRETAFILLLLAASGLPAASAAESSSGSGEASARDFVARRFVTDHRMSIGKDTIAYTATAADTILLDADGKPKATIFSISYVKQPVEKAADRPITFLFNGGPGSSAVWLHLGAFGPKRLDLPSDAINPGGPPYRLVDNPHTLLSSSDLVFVDPIGTGYSRALGKNKNADYWGVDEDSAVIAEFIRAYLTAQRRWNSPKYLAGESYGTTRAGLLIRDLELKLLDSVFFNGVVLIAVATDISIATDEGSSNEMPYVTNLPTFAATAYYHDALPEKPADLDRFLEEARTFAGAEYLAALFKGSSLSAAEEQAIAAKLHRFTGLSVPYLKRCRLRVDRARFVKELLRERGQTLAFHDTRFVGKDLDDAGENVRLDPFLLGITGPFVAVMNDYLGTELGVKVEEPYTAFSLESNQAWKRAKGGQALFSGFLNTTPHLAEAAATNKDFRVFVVSGLHDLATPFFGTEYVFLHSRIDKERITLKNYFGGHMMYLYEPSLRQMSEDIARFMTHERR